LPEWIVIADDLTGANDTGVCFARRGLRTFSMFDFNQRTEAGDLPRDAQAWVLSTESRYMPADEARRAVEAATGRIVGWIPVRDETKTYKKMDSALRGNPAVELAAVLAASGATRALAAPALPAQARSARGGRAFWRGTPLSQTEFGAQIATDDLIELFEPLEPGCTLRPIPLETVRLGASRLEHEMRGAESGVWVADAETDADLDALAQAGLAAGVQVFCGSAGLANALARTFSGDNHGSGWQKAGSLTTAHAGPVTVVVGTRSPQAALQVEYACQAGALRLEPPLDYLKLGERGALRDWLENNAGKMDQELIITTVGMAEVAPGGQVAARLAEAAVEVVRRAHPQGLMMTGGDTAAAVFSALGCRLVELLDEVEPGMAWGRMAGGELPGLAVITRAGSFGQTDSLRRAILFLEGIST
jgi:uncharacterized protein YgbK (DUF1537 family)